MNAIILSQSFIVKDSLTILFKETFESINLKSENNIDLNNIDYISNLELIIIDTTIESIKLLEYIVALKSINQKLKILIIDFKEDKNLFSQAIKIGVEGYTLNIVDKEEFIYIIKRIISGKKFYDSCLLENGIQDLSISSSKLLTKREFGVLEQVIKGMSNKDIATMLGVTDYTIKKHVSSILSKLNLKSRQDIIVYAKNNQLLGNT